MWAREGGWGRIRYWNPLKEGENKTDRIYLEEYIQTGSTDGIKFSTYQYRKEFEEYLWNTFSLKYDDLIGQDGAINKQLVNTHYFVQLEKIITAIHKKKGFDTEENNKMGTPAKARHTMRVNRKNADPCVFLERRNDRCNFKLEKET